MNESRVSQIAEQFFSAGKFRPSALFSKRQFEVSALDMLSVRSYYDSRKGLFYFCLILAFTCQVASAISGYSFFEFALRVKLSGYYLIACTVSLLLLLEVAKYYLFNTLFADLFRLSGSKPDFGIIVVSLIISSVSIFASVHGGGILATDYSAETTIENRFEARKNAIRDEIKAIVARNTWKGQTWLPKADKALLMEKEKQLQAENTAEQAAQQQAREKNEANAAIYRYGFAAFEVVFIFATLFVWLFRKRVAIEAAAAQPEKTISAPQEAPQQVNPYTADRPQKATIGFQFGNVQRKTFNVTNQKQCEHCGTPFTKKHWNAKYCSDACRIAAWEARTGKTLHKQKKQLDLFQ
jgi:hypothetical protein